MQETRDDLNDLDNLFNHANAPIMVWDSQFRIHRFNRAFEHMTGYPAKEVIGKKLDILFSKNKRKESMDIVKRAMTAERWWSVEIPILRADGSLRFVLWNSANVYAQDDRTLSGVIAHGLDITERKPLEEELRNLEERFELFFESAPDAYYLSDLKGNFINGNKEAEKALGYRREELIGKNFLKLKILSPHQIPKAAVLLAKNALGKPTGPDRFVLNRKDGSQIPVEIRTQPIKIQNQTVVLGIARDITEHKRLEDELKRYQHHLEDLVKKRTEELEQSNAELQHFASTISHDLQEPLRMVSMYTQLLGSRYRDKLDADAKTYIDFASGGAIRMYRLITDVLTYSRVESRQLLVEPVDCAVLLEEVLEDLKVSVKESGAVVTKDALPVVAADKTQIKQMFQNLISNAIKYRGKKTPEIHVGAKREDGHWLFSVRDNGIGIHPKYSKKIFMIFQRLHKQSEYTGTGVGLAICKKIVERHGGCIWVESKAEKGATFYFTIKEMDMPRAVRRLKRNNIFIRKTPIPSGKEKEMTPMR